MKKASLHDRATLMMAHSARDDIPASDYWLEYNRNTLLEIKLVADDPLSADLFFAEAFAGGATGFGLPAPSVDGLRRLLILVLWRPFSERIPWAIRNAPLYKALFGPFFRAAQSLRNNQRNWNRAAKIYVMAVQHLYKTLSDDIQKFGLQPRQCPGPDDVDAVRNNPEAGKYSRETLYRFALFMHFNKLINFRNKTVLEIGTGSGEFARVALRVGQIKRYILIDVAPTLAFAERVLEDEFGSEQIDRFDPDRTSIDFNDGKIATMLTPDQLPFVNDVDIGFNQISFGEMSEHIVADYVSHLIGTNLRDFISINSRNGRLGNRHSGHGNGMADFERLFGPTFKIALKESFERMALMPFFFEDQPDVEDYQLLHFKRI